MLHLTHDHARHNGHADLLHEGIDGAVGVRGTAAGAPVRWWRCR
ncbi:hypothetical protein [Streptomyces sp. BBFR102]